MSQTISQEGTFLILSRHSLFRFLIAAFTTSFLTTASSAQGSGNIQWDCSANGEGNWVCTQQSKTQSTHKRPLRTLAKQPVNPDEPRINLVKNLDWLPKSHMTEEQQANLPPYCCGAYVDPERDYPDVDLDPEEAPLRVNANATEVLVDNIASLEGDVQVSQGYRQIRSDNALVDQASREVTLTGNVQFREPGLLLLGDSAEIDIDSKEVQIDNATYVIHDAAVHGTAKHLSRNKEGLIVISDATYSTCGPNDNTWELITGEIDIDQNTGFATVKNARLEVKDVPVFYFPWVRFPVDDRRSSGLLFPYFRVNQKNGLDYAQPIYWNIAPNYDATFTPRYIEKRGIALETEFRYLNDWGETMLGGAFLPDDQGGGDSDDIDPNTGLRPFEGEDRYLVTLQHKGGEGRPWHTYTDLNEVSDRDYFRDLGDFTLDVNSRTHLQRLAGVGYRTTHWEYLVESEDYQLLTEGLADQYKVLPRVTANGYYRFADNRLVLDMSHQYSVFDHDAPGIVTGDRSRIDYALTWDKRWSWGYFRPQVSAKHLTYNLDGNGTVLVDDNPSATVPVTSLDTGIFFERESPWFSGLTQTFEPRLYYLNVEFDDQSNLPDFDSREFTPSHDLLYRDNRFNGGDRFSDENRLTIGFTTRFINKRNGQERFRASIAQAYYYEDRFVTLPNPTAIELDDLRRNQSPLAMDLAALLSESWHITSDLVYDTSDNELEKSSLGFRYNDHQNRLFNFTYRFTRRLPRQFQSMDVDQDIEQADISAFIPIAENFNVVARWNHDFTNKRELELFAGFEYNSCCWRASLVLRRWLDRDDDILFPEEDLEFDNGIFFQIQFKGLAGTGKRVDSILRNGIYGYEPLEDF